MVMSFIKTNASSRAITFELADTDKLQKLFQYAREDCLRMCESKLPLVAYEHTLKASHYFNMLDARGAVSVTSRQEYILAVRDLAKAVALCYYEQREKLGFPLAPPHLRPEVENDG